MFTPPLFREDRTEVMHELMRAHPFATLVATMDGALTADHLPLALADDGVLQGHIAAGNPLWHASNEGALDVLAIFQGPQTYITPSWYPSKAEHGKAVPTWNYAVVHAHGKLTFRRESHWLMEHLKDLTGRQESHRPVPWSVSDAPEDYVERQLKGIVGIEIRVTQLTGKWKVSQNKDARDREGVEVGLMSEPGGDAELMSAIVRERART